MITLLDHIFFNDTLTDVMYNDFLQNIPLQILEDIDLVIKQCLWIQQDDVPSHYARNVQNTSNQMFSNR